MLVDLRNKRDLEQLLQQSATNPVVVFKHSTQCSRSAGAMAELKDFAAAHPAIPCGVVGVIEHRDLSDDIEDRFDILHESPQAFVVVQGKPAWHAKHWAITAQALDEAIARETVKRDA